MQGAGQDFITSLEGCQEQKTQLLSEGSAQNVYEPIEQLHVEDVSMENPYNT